MARTDVHREMKEMFGEVIGFVDLIPDQFIDSEWDLIKRVQFGETGSKIISSRFAVRPTRRRRRRKTITSARSGASEASSAR